MTLKSCKVGKTTLSVAILLAAAAFFLAGVFNPFQPSSTASTPGKAGAAAGGVSSVTLQASLVPNPVKVGQTLTVSGSLAIVGGPSQGKITLTVPAKGGGSWEGSIMTMLDENGLWGFEAPPFKVDAPPGTYSVTVKAEAGGASATKTVTLTVNPQ